MKRILTGLKPTGDLTLGNLIGAIKPMVELSKDNNNELFLFVADLHALTVMQDPKELHERIRKFVAMYLACGIDTSKTTIYIQSENNYIPSISWLLECVTYYGEASRMIQFKEKSKQNENFSVGLLTYPILMASDILYCDTDLVPVGIDQQQHVEIARDIADRFNKKFGSTFKLPEAYITKSGVKIMDLKNPNKKMSKSEENPAGVISLFDNIDDVRKKIMGATTDSDMKVVFDEVNKPGISNLLNIVSSITGMSISDIEKEFAGKNYGEFKKFVADKVCSELESIQSKYNEILYSDELEKILDNGRDLTNKLAKEKYEHMKNLMGLTR